MKNLKLLGITGLLAGLMLLCVNCAAPAAPITTEPDFTGFITGTQPAVGGTGLLSVESHADKLVARYTITVTADTLIFREDGNQLRETNFASLEDQQWVEIWFSGPVMESWPMQATAAQVVILE